MTFFLFVRRGNMGAGNWEFLGSGKGLSKIRDFF
jgi:hypothetical protein